MALHPNDPYSSVQSVGPEVQQPGAFVRADATPADFGGQIGAAEQGLGAAAEKVGTEASDVAIQYQGLQNKFATDNAFNRHQQNSLNALYGDPSNPDDHGYLSLRGQDALNARAGVSQKLESERQAILNTLQNGIQKTQFDDASRRLNQFTLSQIGNHANQQFQLYGSATQQASQDVKLRAIGSSPDDEDNFQHNLADGLRATAAKAQLAGASPEQAQDATEKFTSAAYETRARAMAANNPSSALQFVQDNRAKMDGVSSAKLIEELQPKVNSASGKSIADAVWGSTPGVSGSAPVDAPTKARAQAVHDEFVRQGTPDDEAWGWAANAVHESGANPSTAPGDGGASHGLLQWNGDRLARYQAAHNGHLPEQDSLGTQVAYALHEKDTTEAAAAPSISAATGPASKALVISASFVRPAGGAGEARSRGATANYLAGNGQGSSPPSGTGPIYPDVSAGVQRILDATEGSEPEVQRAALSAYMQKVNVYRLQTETTRQNVEKQAGDAALALEAGKDDTVIPETDIRASMPPAAAQEMVDKLQTAKLAGQIMKGVQWGTPEDVAAARDDLASGLGTRSALLRAANRGGDEAAGDPAAETPDQFGLRQRMLARFDQMTAARAAALKSDPAGYVASNPTVQNAVSAIDPKNPDTFEAYARATTSVQKALGVRDGDTRVLAASQSQSIAQQLVGGDPAKTDVGAQLDGLSKEYGAAWPDVWHDLVRDGHLPGEYQVLGVMPPGPDRMQMQRALQVSDKKGGLENMRKDIDPVAAQSIDRDVDGVLDQFRRTVMIPGLAGNADLFSTVRNAVRTSATYGALSGQSGGDALNKAAAGALPYDYSSGGLARAPVGQAGVADKFGAAIVSGLTPAAIADVKTQEPDMTRDQTQQAYVAAVKRSGVWVTNERDDGWSLAVPATRGGYQLVLKPDGSRVGFKFSDMPKGADTAQAIPAGPPPPAWQQ